jgi:hypothetical protein
MKPGNSKLDRTCATLKMLAAWPIVAQLTTLQFIPLKYIIELTKRAYTKKEKYLFM